MWYICCMLFGGLEIYVFGLTGITTIVLHLILLLSVNVSNVPFKYSCICLQLLSIIVGMICTIVFSDIVLDKSGFGGLSVIIILLISSLISINLYWVHIRLLQKLNLKSLKVNTINPEAQLGKSFMFKRTFDALEDFADVLPGSPMRAAKQKTPTKPSNPVLEPFKPPKYKSNK